MNAETARTLLALNRQFYDRFAADFAATRGPQQPGLRQLLPLLSLPDDGWLLDVGCGNGRLAKLLEAELAPRRLHYIGVDASDGLLTLARQGAASLDRIRATFVRGDVTTADWMTVLPANVSFHAITLLAVLHHLPGRPARRQLLATLSSRLAPGGVLAISTWQFLNSQRLRRKIVPWEMIGLQPAQVDPGDYLLDWQRGGRGLRYCRLIDEQEIAALADEAGLSVHTTFYADGREGNLNLFALLRPH